MPQFAGGWYSILWHPRWELEWYLRGGKNRTFWDAVEDCIWRAKWARDLNAEEAFWQDVFEGWKFCFKAAGLPFVKKGWMGTLLTALQNWWRLLEGFDRHCMPELGFPSRWAYWWCTIVQEGIFAMNETVVCSTVGARAYHSLMTPSAIL